MSRTIVDLLACQVQARPTANRLEPGEVEREIAAIPVQGPGRAARDAHRRQHRRRGHPPGALKDLSERYRLVGAREVAPASRAHDIEHAFDREAWRRVGQSGLFRLHVPRALGGEGLGLREWGAALEGFALGCQDLGFAVSIVAHAGCLVPALVHFGTPAQHERYLPKLLSGEWVGAVANAEPRGGTDVLSLRSRATRTADGFVLHARKRSITNVGPADLVLTSARLDGYDPRRDISIFLVDGRGPRVWQRPLKDLMGLRTSPTGNLLAWRAPLPKDAVLGKEGEGARFFRFVFELERLLIGFLYLAGIRRSLERAVLHAETPRAFGDVLGKNQYVQDKVVRMRIAEELLSAQLERTIEAHLRGEDVTAQLSIIKAWGVDVARQSAGDLIGLLGGRGLRQVERAEKDFRDLMGLSILGGTQELQKIVIYRETVKDHAKGRPAVAPPDAARRPYTLRDVRSG